MEKEQKKYWFFGSKLNTALLLTLIILMVIALRWMARDKEKYLPTIDQKDTTNQTSNQSETKADTYTYTNHGFSIELPKEYKPEENTNARGTRTEIFLPDSLLTYVTDVSVWENNAYSNFENKGNEKVGSTTFIVYYNILTKGNIYWFKQGKVGYAFSGDKKILETFKFVGWPQIEGNKDDLISFSIKPGQEVSGVIKATGVLSGGYFFEGNLPISILDANKKVTSYGPGHGQATTDSWTAGPVNFEADFNFTSIPKGKYYIKLMQDDPSGGANGFAPSSILIPITVK